MWAIAIPFVLQMIAIGIDEVVFHYKRGLPQWERIGHPLDTLSLLICLGIVLFIPFSKTSLIVFCCFAVVSCLMVTKDEFVHKHHCPASENWLHACLFILHPIVLLALGLLWPIVNEAPVFPWLSKWLHDPKTLKVFIWTQGIMMSGFFLYQIVFWNFIWRHRPVTKN